MNFGVTEKKEIEEKYEQNNFLKDRFVSQYFEIFYHWNNKKSLL